MSCAALNGDGRADFASDVEAFIVFRSTSSSFGLDGEDSVEPPDPEDEDRFFSCFSGDFLIIVSGADSCGSLER